MTHQQPQRAIIIIGHLEPLDSPQPQAAAAAAAAAAANGFPTLPTNLDINPSIHPVCVCALRNFWKTSKIREQSRMSLERIGLDPGE